MKALPCGSHVMMSSSWSLSSTDMSFWGKVIGTSSAVVAALHRSSWAASSCRSLFALPVDWPGVSTISVLVSASVTLESPPPARLASAEAAASKDERRRTVASPALFILLLILSLSVL